MASRFSLLDGVVKHDNLLVALQAVSAEMGSIEIISGSHRAGLASYNVSAEVLVPNQLNCRLRTWFGRSIKTQRSTCRNGLRARDRIFNVFVAPKYRACR